MTAIFKDFAAVIVGKLPLFIGIIIALGFLLLLLAFRSIVVPLTAAAMNLVAVAAVLRRPGRDLPVGLGQRAARPRRARARSSPSSR